MFGEQAIRIRREAWQIYGRDGKPDIVKLQQFAEEISAILENTAELTHYGPLNIYGPQNSNATKGPLSLFPIGDQPAISIIKQDGTRSDIGQDGTVSEIDEDGNGTPRSGGGLAGKVVSGSGTSYVVDLYESSLTTASQRVSASAPYLNSTETIPAGDWVSLTRIGSSYLLLTDYFH